MEIINIFFILLCCPYNIIFSLTASVQSLWIHTSYLKLISCFFCYVFFPLDDEFTLFTQYIDGLSPQILSYTLLFDYIFFSCLVSEWSDSVIPSLYNVVKRKTVHSVETTNRWRVAELVSSFTTDNRFINYCRVTDRFNVSNHLTPIAHEFVIPRRPRIYNNNICF